MWQVEIYFNGDWWPIGPQFNTEADASYVAINWCQCRGMTLGYAGVRLIRADDEYVTLDSALSARRPEEESGVDLGGPDMPKWTGPNLA